MKYEEIKIGDVFTYIDDKETVISKSDQYKIITTIDDDMISTTWKEEDLYLLEPIKEELPEEGLLVSENGSLVYRTGLTSGYGFEPEEDYSDIICWTFVSNSTYWRKATEQEENKFVELLKKECENRGLFEDTKLEKLGINSDTYELNKDVCHIASTPVRAWNKNGKIFYKGEFATPRKEETLELVSKASLDLSKFGVEIEQKGNVLIINPIKR